MKFSGIFTALITPFQSGRVDLESFKNLIEFQINNNVDGFVVNGTTAESPNLSKAEVESLYHVARDVAGADFPIIVGAGSNSTSKTIETCQWAENLGANGLLVVVPYYNKPPQRGMVEHFKSVAESVSTDIILYNVPGRTVVSMNGDTVGKLSEVKNIVAIKEASADMNLLEDIKLKTPGDFMLSSGDDDTCVEFFARGGHGVISVVSHIIPGQLKEHLASRDPEKYQAKFGGLLKAMYAEANPMGVKAALKAMGIIKSSELRLPLVEMSEACRSTLEAEMKKVGILQ